MTLEPLTIDTKYAAYLPFLGFDQIDNVVIKRGDTTYKIQFAKKPPLPDGDPEKYGAKDVRILELEAELEGTTGDDRRRIYQRLWRLKKKLGVA